MAWAKIQPALIKPNILLAVSREDLLNRADTYVINTFADGTYDTIECYQQGTLIHTTKANYQSSPNPLTGVPDLESVSGFLFPEVWNAFLVEQTTVETAGLITSNATLNANFVGSAISKNTAGKILFVQSMYGQSTGQASINLALNNAPVNGDFLFIGIVSRLAGTQDSVTGILQKNVSWSKVTEEYAGGNETISVWKGVVSPNADVNIQVNLNSAASWAACDVLEFALNSAATDLTVNATGNANPSSTGNMANTAQAAELCIVVVGCENIQTTPTAGWTIIDGQLNGIAVSIAVLYNIASGVFAPDAGTNTGGFTWVTCLATFKAN